MSFVERIFGKKREVKLPGVEGSAPIKPVPKTEEGLEAMAAAKGIHPYVENAELENIENPDEDGEEVDVDVSDLK